MSKRNLNVGSAQPPKAKKRLVFRVAHPPPNRAASSTTLVTTLRKGSNGRRGHRRDQLGDPPPGGQPLPFSETTRDALPDLDHLGELDDIVSCTTPSASKPKRVQTNTTSVSTHS